MALALRFLEARIKGDLDTVYEMMPPDFVSHTKLLPDQEPTREGQRWGPPNSLRPPPTAAYASRTR
jgi:hypothetical protein